MDRTIAVSLAVAAVAMIVLATNLPVNAFYAGDSGVKLVAARNVVAHPLRPFQVDLPRIGGTPVPYVERFFVVHGEHAHALQSPVFPILSAPLLAALGLSGLYVLPIVSFLAVLPFVNLARTALLPEVPSGWVAIFATIASPVFFYALEYWEHVPAIACLAASTTLLLYGRRWRWAPYFSGIAAGAATLLRPEAFWYAGMLCFLAWPRRVLAGVLVGLAGVVLPYALFNVLEFGNVAGAHVSANLAPLTDDWVAARQHRFALWFVPGHALAWPGLALLAVMWVAAAAGFDRARVQVVALLVAATLATAAAAGSFARESLWHAWPAAFLLLVPMRRRIASIWALILVPVAAIWLSSTHDGGAQWGPRFVLIVTPVLILAAAAIAADVTRPGWGRRTRVILVLVVVLACVWTTRAAYRELRGTKRIYAALVNSVEAHVRPGSYVVTNLWWFDQVAAALSDTRTFLFADSQDTAKGILRQLAAADAGAVTVVWSRDPVEGESLVPALSDTCYRFVHVRNVSERALSLGTAACAPSADR